MRLAVNIDHIATIREARKSDEPDPIAAAVICELAGAQGITVHLRGDYMKLGPWPPGLLINFNVPLLRAGIRRMIL